MRNKLLVFFFSLICFSVPCFAADFPTLPSNIDLSSYKYCVKATYAFSGYEVHKVFLSNTESFTSGSGGVNLKCAIYYLVEGSSNWQSQPHDTWVVLEPNSYLYNFTTNSTALYNAFVNNTSNSTVKPADVPPVDIPPLLAPNVGQSLSTENVLSAILPLVPTILAFLVLCWSFYKGYSMLLRILGQA